MLAESLAYEVQMDYQELLDSEENQDPLDPVKSEDFAVQLATFSGVEQQVLTNDLLESLLAQNGLTIDRIQFGANTNDYIYIVNTQMQSGAGTVYDELRAAQQDELYNLIALHTDSAHPVVMVGDLNVIEAVGSAWNRTQTPQYFDMLGRLGLGMDSDQFRSFQHNAGNADGFTVDPNRNKYARNGSGAPIGRLDYILLRQGTEYRLIADSIEMTDAPVTTTQCSSWQDPASVQCYLSDHFGLAAQLRLIKP